VDSIQVRQLKSISFFRSISDETLEVVARRMVPRSVPAGRILFRKGEPCRGVYLLVEGEVEIYRSSSDGREQVIHTEVPVRSIAELPLFDGGPYPASARATEDSRVHFLSLDDFQRLYHEHPEIADSVIRSLGHRLRTLVKLVEKISLKSIPARVATVLLEVAEEAGALEDGGSFTLNRTQAELARMLATTRESVARALADFRNEEIIEQKGRRVTLLSVTALEDVALEG
jgi:CRP/FNR family transcriptional regulator